MIRLLRAGALAAFERFPGLRRAAYAVWEPILCFVLLPFLLPSPPGRAIENPRVVERTAEYNEAAERYELPARDIGRFWVAGGSAVTGWPAS